MSKRIKQSLAFIAGIALSPIWFIGWIFTGKNLTFMLLDYAVRD